jgi:biopolymer transport protein TolQ
VRIDLARSRWSAPPPALGLLTTPLRDRFGIPVRLNFYDHRGTGADRARGARMLGIGMTADGATEIARRSRGTPRIAGRLLRRVRDFAAVDGRRCDRREADPADKALLNTMRLEVDASPGSTQLDRRYMRLIAENFGGGPVGIETIAAALSEPRDAIEEIVEPFLMQQGFVQRTPRGRKFRRHLRSGRQQTRGGDPPAVPFGGTRDPRMPLPHTDQPRVRSLHFIAPAVASKDYDPLMNPVELTQTALSAPSADLSLIGLFLQAHFVVKLVMVGLLVASIWCWAIVVDKVILFTRTRRSMDRFEKVFWSGQSLEELYRSLMSRPNQGLAAVFVAAMREWKRSHEAGRTSFLGLTDRIQKVIDVTISREMERYESKLLVLATVGSAGPFIGLFGTVWGIMTSFQAIAASKNTNLAVVAPGIAEALFATAIGLAAAIPAVLAYNKFATDASKLGARMEGFADEFSAILSRQIDDRS